MEDDTQSWKDRCDRYFSSIEDSDEKSKETTKSQEKNWKELSEICDGSSHKNSAFSRIKSFISTVDVHGCKLAGSSTNSISSCLWIILSLLFCTALAFSVYLTLQSYLTHSSQFLSTDIRVSPDETTVEYNPSITLCNMNILRKSKLQNSRFHNLLNLKMKNTSRRDQNTEQNAEILLKQTDIWEMLTKSFSDQDLQTFATNLNEEFSPYLEMSSADDWDGAFSASIKYNPEIFQEILMPTRQELQEFGHQRQQMLIDCWIDRKFCRDSNFVEYQDQKFGNCVKINPGTGNGIESMNIMVNTEPDEYIDGVSQSIGLMVFVHDNRTDVRGGSAFSVSPGKSLELNIRKMTTIHYDNKKCNNNDDYNKYQCQQNRMDSLTTKYCRCKYSLDAPITEQCKMSNKFDNICVRSVKKLLQLEKLRMGCLPNCRMTVFDVDSSAITWPSSSYLTYLMYALENRGLVMNETDICRSLAQVHIRFDAAFHEKLEESSMTLLQVLSNIGGLSALLVGMSVLSLLEILWLVIKLIFYGCRGATRNRKSGKSVHRLAESEITSVTWTAYKERRRQEVLKEQSNVTFTSHALRRSFNSSRPFLLPITEEEKSEDLDRNSAKNVDNLYSHPWERTGHSRMYNNILNSSKGSGSEFPLFNSLDEREIPRSSTPTGSFQRSSIPTSNFQRHYRPSNEGSRTRHYNQQREKIITPGDAVQMYGTSAAKYYCSEPLYL